MNQKYVRVMNGLTSHANGFEYKLNEVNITDVWNPKAFDPKDFGGFNFSTEDKVFRWLLRGDTLYDVEIPNDAEIVEVESPNCPHGVFRSNKIIISNPRKLTEDIIMDLYLKSDLPEKSYFQCLTFLCFKNCDNVCRRIVKDKVNANNIDLAINTFENFFDLKEEDKNDIFKEISKMLLDIKNSI